MNIVITEMDGNRMKVLESLKRGEMTQEAGAKMLGIGTRQVRRLLKRYNENGLVGIIHKNRGRPSRRKMPPKERKRIAELIATHYADFGPTLAAEVLQERHNIIHHKEVIRRIMIDEGLWVRQRKRRKHRFWRHPREYRGEMTQTDTSKHDWFEGRGPWCHLIAFLDDATMTLFHAEFAPNESYHSYARASINYFTKCGLPESMYTDKGGVFSVNHNNEDGTLITQYHANLEALGIELKKAHSPQAKGRVERGFRTHQDRLVKALRLESISTIDAANEYLRNIYIPKHNAKFARAPLCEGDRHRSAIGINFLDVFCLQETRTVRNDWTIQYKNQLYQISDMRPAIVKPKDVITVYERLDQSINLKIRGVDIEFTAVGQRPFKSEDPKPVRKLFRPAKNHPWRRWARNNSLEVGHFHCAKKEDILTVP